MTFVDLKFVKTLNKIDKERFLGLSLKSRWKIMFNSNNLKNEAVFLKRQHFILRHEL